MNKFIIALFVVFLIQIVFQSNALINTNDNMVVDITTASPVLEKSKLTRRRRYCVVMDGQSLCSTTPECTTDAFGHLSCVGKK